MSDTFPDASAPIRPHDGGPAIRSHHSPTDHAAADGEPVSFRSYLGHKSGPDGDHATNLRSYLESKYQPVREDEVDLTPAEREHRARMRALRAEEIAAFRR
jgi:hypothetical protein